MAIRQEGSVSSGVHKAGNLKVTIYGNHLPKVRIFVLDPHHHPVELVHLAVGVVVPELRLRAIAEGYRSPGGRVRLVPQPPAKQPWGFMLAPVNISDKFQGHSILDVGASKNQGHLIWTQHDRIPYHTSSQKTRSPQFLQNPIWPCYP